MEHYDVLIATPGAKMEGAYVSSLVNTLAACDERGITYRWLNGQSSLVHHARELTASGGEDKCLNPHDRGPLNDKVSYKKIFWIDSDISWTPEQFFKIYDSEYDVATGAYLLADRTTTSVHAWGTPGGMAKHQIKMLKEPLKIQSMGFGFVAMKSGVFERLERPWFKHFDQEVPTADGRKVVDSIGEDISWCIRAYQAGIDLYLIPKVLVNHTKTTTITWD